MEKKIKTLERRNKRLFDKLESIKGFEDDDGNDDSESSNQKKKEVSVL